jgi:hypothetical protein
MGALIPSTDDTAIINQLNAVFTGSKLLRVRRHIRDKHDEMFASTRNLARISFRLKVFPTGNRGKGRWFKFLRSILSRQNKLDILTGLRDAAKDWDPVTEKANCVGIRFWARFDPSLTVPYKVEVISDPPDANGQHWVSITLLCDHEIDPSDPGDPSTPPPDDGEAGPVQPVVTSTSKKKAVKKAAKKAAKKSYKKATKNKK